MPRVSQKIIAIIEQDTNRRVAALQEVIRKRGGQAFILVPQVWMLAQYEGAGTVYHAGMRQSEKRRIWDEVKTGAIRTVIGTQKALFLPFCDLQTVIVDEEQLESHKLWDQYPRLHGVRAAAELARIWKAQLVYASSFPSVRLAHAIAQKTVSLRINNPTVLQCDIIPYSFDDRKYKRPLPDDVRTIIRKAVKRGERVLVLYNKKDNAKLLDSLLYRMSKRAKEKIVIGTIGLLAMPHAQPYGLVVWAIPEMTLRAIDHRSSERARAIAARLQQISRTGRITVCTKYQDIVRDALAAPANEWLEKTLAERRRLHLPPYADLVRLTVRDVSEKKACKRAEEVRFELVRSLETSAHVFGPYQELGKKQGKYHVFHILLSGSLPDLMRAYGPLPIDSADADPHRVV